MKILRGFHTGYGLLIFVIVFLILLPFFCVPIFFPKRFRWTGVINRIWARIVLTLVFIPFKVEYRAKLDRKKVYIFCPNHFSYFDIPALGLNHYNAIFVGKSSMEEVPVFGYMYKKLHITVDRSKLKSRYETMKKTLNAIDEGKSLVIYPEGGIITEREPVMSRFKDGAFRAAIEKQIEIVPVTIPFNWIILPADQFLLRWHPLKIVFHEPIDASAYTMEQIDELKERTRNIIDAELKKHLKS
jgi:1-acyl-sn-glycerol-3-phosphate acyltransferase